MRAVSRNDAPRSSGLWGGWPLLGFFGGSVLLFLAERVLEQSAAELPLIVAGWLLLGAGAALRLLLLLRSRGEARRAELVLLLTHLGGAAAAGLYYLGAARSAPGGAAARPDGATAGVVLQVAWTMLWTISAAVLLFVDRAYGPMRKLGTAEGSRVQEALRAGLEVTLLAALLMTVNYLATAHDKVVDVSYFRTARPGEATIKLVRSLDEPVEVLLFFPPANEVAEEVKGYLQPLQQESPQLRVRQLDRLLEPALARKYEVRTDGTVVVVRGERHGSLRLGDEQRRARSKLRELDGEFQRRLMLAVREERTAYLVKGHGERGTTLSDDERLPGIRGLRKLLDVQGYRVKELGLAQGLGHQIPDDAGMVLLLGPRQELLPQEVESLQRYLQRGGRLLIALDPQDGQRQEPLMTTLGLRFEPHWLVAERDYLRQHHTPADRRNLITDVYSSHPTVATLSRLSQRIATVFPGAGSLLLAPRPDPEMRVETVVRSLPHVWRDVESNLRFDPREKREEYDLVMAVSLPVGEQDPAPAADDGQGQPAKAPSPLTDEGRALVLADADSLTDLVMGNPANQVFAGDALRWLAGEESLGGTIISETDIPVHHTREGQAIWFYSTVFAAPLLVLGAGLALRRRRRQ